MYNDNETATISIAKKPLISSVIKLKLITIAKDDDDIGFIML